MIQEDKGVPSNLLNNWTLMKENIWVNTLRTKNGGTWKLKIK